MSLATNVTDLATRVATEIKALRTLINGNAADLSALDTTATSSLVAAVNELKADLDALSGGAAGIDDGTTDTDSTWSSSKITTALAALETGILGAGVPAALDTLDELAAALGDDANFAATVTTALGNKQPLDTDLTAIAGLTSAANKVPYATGAGTWALADFTAAGRALVDDADAAAQRATLSVYSQTEIGSPTTDFVATFEAGLV